MLLAGIQVLQTPWTPDTGDCFVALAMTENVRPGEQLRNLNPVSFHGWVFGYAAEQSGAKPAQFAIANPLQ
jgi:hypothetical protein